MSNREALLRFIREETARTVAAGPEACRRYLIALGTHNTDGTLTKEYGGEYTLTDPDKAAEAKDSSRG